MRSHVKTAAVVTDYALDDDVDADNNDDYYSM